MTVIEIGTLDSPIGRLEVAVSRGLLCALSFEERWPRKEDRLFARFPEADVRAAPDPGGTVSALRAYFGGDLSAIDALDVDVEGTDFQQAVWQALRAIPVGRTATYGAVAERIERPRAVRAVGTATGSNPVGIVIPCHRVVPSGGGVGNYGGGSDRKAWLLEHEGASA